MQRFRHFSLLTLRRVSSQLGCRLDHKFAKKISGEKNGEGRKEARSSLFLAGSNDTLFSRETASDATRTRTRRSRLLQRTGKRRIVVNGDRNALSVFCLLFLSAKNEKGSYASGEYIGEDRYQNLKMGLLPSAFSLMWGSAFGATAHAAVHGAAHDAFMTLPAYTRKYMVWPASV